jgi:hypothetical protein
MELEPEPEIRAAIFMAGRVFGRIVHRELIIKGFDESEIATVQSALTIANVLFDRTGYHYGELGERAYFAQIKDLPEGVTEGIVEGFAQLIPKLPAHKTENNPEHPLFRSD